MAYPSSRFWLLDVSPPLRGRARGASIIEFIIILPFVMILAFGVVDAAVFIRQMQVIQDAVQEAAYTAAKMNGVPREHRGFTATDLFGNYLYSRNPAQYKWSRFFNEMQFGTDYWQWRADVTYPTLSIETYTVSGAPVTVEHRGVLVQARLLTEEEVHSERPESSKTSARTCLVCFGSMFSKMIHPPSALYGYN